MNPQKFIWQYSLNGSSSLTDLSHSSLSHAIIVSSSLLDSWDDAPFTVNSPSALTRQWCFSGCCRRWVSFEPKTGERRHLLFRDGRKGLGDVDREWTARHASGCDEIGGVGDKDGEEGGWVGKRGEAERGAKRARPREGRLEVIRRKQRNFSSWRNRNWKIYA